MTQPLKIALVHDYLKEYGGAESVFEALSDIYPDADIYTTLYRPSFFGPHRQRLEKKWSHRVHQSFFNFLPYAHKLISPLRLFSPLAFGLFDFQKYDLIITSATGAYFPNSLNKKSAKLICYCHTPPRYLYNLATARDLSKYRPVWALAQIANHFLRLLDFKYSQNVDHYLANSSTTAARIQKFYRRDSIIVNPPVDLPQNSALPALSREGGRRRRPEGFFLTGGRLAWAKHYDVAIEACNRLKLPLKVFGRDFAGNEAKLKSLAGPTVEFLGEVDQSQKDKLFSKAKAYFFCSDNEDFGIVSVEAQAHGCPVIGYRSGGIVETVIDGKTGVLFDELTPESCTAAVSRFQKLKINRQDCIKNSQKFSKEVFVSRIKNLVSSL